MSDQLVESSAIGPVDVDETTLAYTQGVRKKIVEHLTKKTEDLDDVKLVNTVSALLDGMDRQALGKMRIKAEERQANNQEGMAANIAEMLRQMTGQNPQARVTVPRDAPALGNDVPDPPLVDGETSVNPPQQNFDTFQAQFPQGEA